MDVSSDRYPSRDPDGDGAHQDRSVAAPTFGAADLILILRRRIMLIATIIISVTGLSWLLASNLTPQYTASAILLLESEDTSILQRESDQVMSGQAQAMIVDTQMRVLRSRSFARTIVKELDLREHPAFTRDDFEKSSLVDQTIELIRTALDRPLMAASKEEETAPAAAELEEEVVAQPAPPIDTHSARALARLQAGLAVDQEGHSSTISISYKSSDPVLSANMANRIADLYVKNQLASKQSSTNRASDWLKKRLEQLRQQVIASENAVATYRAQNKLAKEPGRSLDDQQLANLGREIISAKARVIEAEAKIKLISETGTDEKTLNSVSEVANSPIIATLRNEEVRLLRDEAQLLQEFGPRHPRILEIQAQKNDLRNKIQLELAAVVGLLENEFSLAKARYATLEAAMREASSQLNIRQQAEVQLNELEREAEANRQLYISLLTRHKELGEEKNLLDAGAKIISDAVVPTEPSFPQPKLIVAVGFVVSLMSSALAAVLRENLERGLCSSRQIEQKIGLTNYGLVPFVVGDRHTVKLHEYLVEKPNSSYAEAIRSIWVSLKLAKGKYELLRTWVITSSLPNEGKTTLAKSLAFSLANGGYRTVLIDFDLRNPSVADQLGIEPKVGLNEYLDGEASIEEVTVKTVSDMDDLHVIPIATPPRDPVKTLISTDIQGLLDYLQSVYDFVIIDCPPVLGIADTKLTARLASGVVLMAVRWGRTSATVVRNAVDLLTKAEISVDGTVLTRVDLKRHAKLAYGDAEQYYKEYKKYYVD